MVWPAANVNTTNADAGTDSPASFRDDALDLINKFNQLRSHPSPFIQGLLDDIDAAAARATLGAVGTLGNEAIEGSKTFSNGVGIAGQAADETGWTLTGYLRGLLLPATRAIWWAKGAASRSIGIVRQAGSNVLRIVSSTADDGTAAAFDALTVDVSNGNVFTPGAISAGTLAATTVDADNGGAVTLARPSSSSLAGNVQLRLFTNQFIVQDAGNARFVAFDLSKAAFFGSDGFFVVAQSLGSNGFIELSNGLVFQWGRSGVLGDFSSFLDSSVSYNTSMTTTYMAVMNATRTAGDPRNAYVLWRPAGTTSTVLGTWIYENGSLVQSTWDYSWFAIGRK